MISDQDAQGNRPTRGARRATWVALGLLALAVLAAVVVVDQVQVRQASQDVAVAFAAGRLDEAKAQLEFWRRRRPRAVEPILWRCRLAIREGRNDDAVAAWNEARQRGGNGPELALLGAILQVRAAKYSEAEPVLRGAWQRAPTFDRDLGEALARLYLETFRLGSAREVLDRWAEAVPDDPKPWLWRAEVDTRLDDPAPVLRDYREALRRDPELLEPRRKLAEGLWADGQLDEAERQFQEYLRHRPDDAEAWLGAARVALGRADWPEAARLLAQGLEVDPKQAALWSERGNLNLARNDPEAARADFAKSAQLDPFEPETRRRLALALSRLGHVAEAEAAVQEARRLGEEREQMRAIRDRLTRSPNDREAQVAAARWLIEHNHAEEGLRWARQVLSQDPANQATHALLAEYYQARGDVGLANYHRMRVGEKR